MLICSTGSCWESTLGCRLVVRHFGFTVHIQHRGMYLSLLCPQRKARWQQSVLFLFFIILTRCTASCLIILPLCCWRTLKGKKRLNSSVEYSLEANQEKTRNYNLCLSAVIHFLFCAIFLTGFLSQSERVVPA